ncbi:uncharacterized protein PAC_05480 [Phialocephala subalpina]|uniref:Uncharacterized protein n=1 Tax=Phialocephala subalpina TaxID=576137 RepID=A0A1L7WS49_9HELO|nr:uncharacterized protein PAC_05480 [Phialocephala subalpina]
MPPAQDSDLSGISATTTSKDTTNSEDSVMPAAQVFIVDLPQPAVTNSKDSTDSIDFVIPQARHSENSSVAWLADLPAEIWTLVAEQWLAEPLPNRLAHAKHFEVTLYDFDESGSSYKSGTHNGYAVLVTDIVKRMPNMHSFQWIDEAYEEPFLTSLIINNEGLLTALKDHLMLRNLSIMFMTEPVVGSQTCWTDLNGFRNLTSLELYHFCGDERRLVQDIANLLHNNQGLRKLGLAMACGADPVGWLIEVVVSPEKQQKQHFLEKLCIEYATVTPRDTAPLNLNTLRLGHGIFVDRPTSSESAGYLAKLVKIDQLTTLRLFNGHTIQDFDDTDLKEIEVDWNLFNPSKSLRQLSVTRLSRKCRDWINNSGMAIEELLVTDNYGGREDIDLLFFDSLRLPKLSMIAVWEYSTNNRLVINGDGAHGQSDSDSHMSETDSEAVNSDFHLESDQECTIEEREADQSDSEQDSGSKSDPSSDPSEKANILDRLQLRISSQAAHEGLVFPSETTLWPGVTKRSKIAHRYAQLAKSLCPSLQLIRVDKWAWEVTSSQGIETPGADIYRLIKLRSLEFEEMLAIDQFGCSRFVDDSGLPRPETIHMVRAEED